MSLVAEAHVAHPDLVLTPTIRTMTGASVEVERRVGRDSDPSFLFFRVTHGSFDRFEEALSSDRTVTDPLAVSTVDGRRLYRVSPTADRKRIEPVPASLGINLERTYSSDGGWTLRLRLSDRDVLSAFCDYCDEEGIRIEINRLRRASAAEAESHGLTDAQRDLLVAAHEAGYFEDPRSSSLQDLAEQFDVSPTALGRRLRRAEDNLIRAVLDS